MFFLIQDIEAAVKTVQLRIQKETPRAASGPFTSLSELLEDLSIKLDF